MQKKKEMDSAKLAKLAISQKSRSRAKGAFKGIGDFPNKQQNADLRASENPRFAPLMALWA